MKIKVLKNDDNIFILDSYSSQHNLLLKIGLGQRNKQINFSSTFLVPVKKQLSPNLSEQGKLIHDCRDDSTPWTINNTCIGANHGFYGGILIDSPEHGLTNKETGIPLTDLNGNKFYVIKIIGSRRFWILGENNGLDGIWNLNQKLIGSTLRDPTGKTIKIKSKEIVQIGPTCRIKDQNFFIDGKTSLIAGKIIKCDFLDINEEYDILAPDSVLGNLKKNPGHKFDFIAKHIESVISNKIRYRFMPHGACTIQHNSTANRDFKLERMGFIQTARLCRDNGYLREYYIPKTLAFETEGCEFNFESIQKISGKIPSNYFSAQNKNISDPMSLPDRFIQFLSKNKKRKVGYAVGYSLIKGMSRPEIRRKNCSKPLCIYFTKKIYPFAIDKKMGLIKKGTTFDVLGYRQYFNPELNEDATAIYFHKQGDSTVIYMHFHKNIKNKLINLPDTLVGKKISVVEKTPSFKLLTTNNVAAEGIKVSVNDNYGYAVLKFN